MTAAHPMTTSSPVPGRATTAISWLVVALALVLPIGRSLVTVLAPLITLLFFFQHDLKSRLRAVLRCRPAMAILVFIAVHVLSLLWSQHPGEGFEYVDKFRYLLLVPVVATSLEPRRIPQVLAAFLCGIVASLAWSYGIVLGLIEVGKGFPENPAPTMNHLDYSMFLAVAALMVLALALHRSSASRSERLGWLALLAFVVGGLFVNIGRSGQVAFFAGLLVLLYRRLPGRGLGRLLPAATLTAVVLVILYAAFPVFRMRTDSAVDEVRAAVTDSAYDTNQGKRVATMLVAADIVRSHPLLGVGVGDTMVEFQRRVAARGDGMAQALATVPHLHNQYLQVAVEVGLVGLLALGGMFWTLLGHREGHPVLRTLMLVLVAVYAVGFLGDPFLHKQLPLTLFSLLAGVLLAGTCSPEGRGEGSPAPRGDVTQPQST